MKKQRILAMLIAVMTLLTGLTMPIHAEDTLALTLTDNVQEGHSLSVGDTVTYSVTVTENSGGFCVGSFFFLPSDNLQYVSSTVLDEDFEAKPVLSGDYAGAYGSLHLDTPDVTETDITLCTMTFRVVGLGEATVRFHPFDVRNSSTLKEIVNVSITPDATTHTITTPDKPTILTESLKNGVLNKAYTTNLTTDFAIDLDTSALVWEVSDGELPAGLELLNDGTLTGTPTEFGSFTFSVTLTLLETVVSEEKELTLTILEKPQKLELTDESTYTIDEEDGYLRNVVAETTLADLLANFLNPETVKVFNAKGNEITDSAAFIGTGATVRLMDGDEAVDSVTVVVRGDVYSDGKITVFDYANIRGFYLKTVELSGAMLEAADVYSDGKITVFDYANVRAHYLKTYNIYK